MSPSDVEPSDRMPSWVPRAILWFWFSFAVLWFARGAVHALRPFFVILVISLFLSFAIEPTVNRLEVVGFRRGLGTGIVFVGTLLALTAFGYAMGRVLSDQVNEFVGDAPGYITDVEQFLIDRGLEVNFDDLRNEFVQGGSAQAFAQRLAGQVVNLGTTVAAGLFHAFAIGLFTFYLVAEGPKLRRTVCSLLPPERQREVLRVWNLAIEKTGGYIASRALLGLISSLAHWVALAVIGVPFPLPLALWVGFMSQFVPVVGTYLAGAFPLLIAFIDSPVSGLWTLAFIVVYQQVENYVLLPRITARTMELHVAVAFASVIIGAALLGPVGALLALPAAATLQAFVSTYINRHEVDEEALAASTGRKGLGRVSRRWPRRPTAPSRSSQTP